MESPGRIVVKVIGIVAISLLLIAVGIYFLIGTRSTESTGVIEHPKRASPLLVDTLDINQLTLLAVSVQDQKAVLSLGGAETVVVSKGEFIGSKEFRLLQITNQRIVLKRFTNDEMYFVYVQGEREKARNGSLVQKLSALIERQETQNQAATPVSVVN
jgi:hypothetical protein